MSEEVIAGSVGILAGLIGLAMNRRCARIIRDPAMQPAARVMVILSSVGLLAYGCLLVGGAFEFDEGADSDSELPTAVDALIGLLAIALGAALVVFRRHAATFFISLPGSWKNRRFQEASVALFGLVAMTFGLVALIVAFRG